MNKNELDTFIDNLMEERAPGQETEISMDQIQKLEQSFTSIHQSTIEKVKAPCLVIGDVHGQFYDVFTYIKQFTVDRHFIFLGDYVDRGYQSIETILLLVALKVKYPDNFTLLRGNHELSDMYTNP